MIYGNITGWNGSRARQQDGWCHKDLNLVSPYSSNSSQQPSCHDEAHQSLHNLYTAYSKQNVLSMLPLFYLPCQRSKWSRTFCVELRCHLALTYCHSSFVFFSAFPWGLRDVANFYPPEGLRAYWGKSGAKVTGTPWMSLIAGPLPLRMTVAAPQGVNGPSGAILGFSILLKDTSACSSVPPQGNRGFRTSNLLITGAPALPTELQPPLYCHSDEWITVTCFVFLSSSGSLVDLRHSRPWRTWRVILNQTNQR